MVNANHCESCGAPPREGAKFCPACGTKVPKPPAADQQDVATSADSSTEPAPIGSHPLDAIRARRGERDAASTATSTESEVPSRVGLTLGVVAVLVVGIGLVVWLSSGSDEEPEEKAENTADEELVDDPSAQADDTEPEPPRPAETAAAAPTKPTNETVGESPIRRGLPLRQRRDSDGVEVVLVRSSKVRMGLSNRGVERELAACESTGSTRCSERRLKRERGEISVLVKDFYIDRTEVTQDDWALCVEAGVCDFIDEGSCSIYDGNSWKKGRRLPVDVEPQACVTWHEAERYCEWAEARLPTEAEWTLAASGPDQRTFPWGDTWDASKVVFDTTVANLGSSDSHPGGATPEGAVHMVGNLNEWVADDACSYSEHPRTAAPCRNGSGKKVTRGGSFASDGSGVRAAYRKFFKPGARVDTNGFRCAIDAQSDWLIPVD